MKSQIAKRRTTMHRRLSSPPEVIYMILDHLDMKSLANFANTCRDFNDDVIQYCLQKGRPIFVSLPETFRPYYFILGRLIKRVTSHYPDVKKRLEIFDMIVEKRYFEITFNNHIPDGSDHSEASVKFEVDFSESVKSVIENHPDTPAFYDNPVKCYAVALESLYQSFTSSEMICIFENCFRAQLGSKLLADVHRDFKFRCANCIPVVARLINTLFLDPDDYCPGNYNGRFGPDPVLIHHILTSGGNDAEDIVIMIHILYVGYQGSRFGYNTMRDVDVFDGCLFGSLHPSQTSFTIRRIARHLRLIKPILERESSDRFGTIIRCVKTHFKLNRDHVGILDRECERM